MFCRKCGTQNPEDAKFCTSCGEKLGDEVLENEVSKGNNNSFSNQQMIDSSIIRKAIKAKAKASSKSSIVITLLLTILLAILGVVIGVANVGLGIIYILLFIVFWLFVFFGIVKGSLEISRGKQIEYMDIIKNSFKNPSWCLKYILGAFVFSFILGILMLIPLIGFILGLVVEIYFIPVLAMYMYKAADPNVQDKSLSSMIKSSMELVKGHRVEFYGLIISFFGWFLLGIVTLGIALLWVIPYINIALANFYRYLNGEEDYTDAEKGLSNTAIIALGVLGYLAFITIIVITIVVLIVSGVISEDKNDRYSGSYDYDGEWHFDNHDSDNTSFDIINMEGVNVAVPSDYTEYSVSGYDMSYMNEDGTVLIATKVMSAANMDLNSYSEELKNSLPSTSYTCEDIESKNINGNDWNKLTCDYSGGTKLYNYIATDSSNVYLVTVTAYNSLSDKGESIAKDVEENLGFAN